MARPVLFLNLPVRDAGNYSQSPGEPVYASLRSLLRSPPSWDVSDCRVYVRDNPNMVAIATDHWGSDCAPLVCTDGMPAAAQRCLLSQLPGQALTGKAARAFWDDGLMTAMQQHDLSIAEEALAASLLRDLRAA